MEIDGRTRVCGLIGNPVEHTLSPAIHNLLAEICEIPLVYVPFPVEQSGLTDAIKGAYALHMLGLNVTVPYKSDVIPCLKEIDPLAEKIGAVNTLVCTQGGYKGYNTDLMGLYRAMRRESIRICGEDVVLLGAGGAARAAAFLCAEKEAANIYILNRSKDRAEELAGEIREKFNRNGVFSMGMEDWPELPDKKMLALQCTSVGLYPHAAQTVIGEKAFYEKIHTGFDLIYRPEETRFMTLVKENGGKAYNGLGMLLYQGIIAFELWNRIQVSEEAAETVYRALKEKVHVKE